MSRLERLRSLVNLRINAAADDISRLLEGKIAEYEEEVRFFREENNNLQQKLLQVAAKPDVHIVLVSEDEAGPSGGHENPDAPQIKEEPEDQPEDSEPAPVSGKAQRKQTQEDKREGVEKDNETPGTSSAKDVKSDGQQCRKNSKRKADQRHVPKSKRGKN